MEGFGTVFSRLYSDTSHVNLLFYKVSRKGQTAQAAETRSQESRIERAPHVHSGETPQ